MERVVTKCRLGLTRLLENEALFLMAAFLLRGVLFVDTLKWHMEGMTHLYTYLLCPWGGALTGLRLARLGERKSGPEMPILFLLYLWIAVPLLWRFGATFNNMVTDLGYGIVFFGLYASLREREETTRERRLQEMGILFALLSLIWCGLLLFCAVTGKRFGEEPGLPFGVFRGFLFAGIHYNSVGMMAIGCLFMSLALCACGKAILLRLMGAAGALAAALVVILSQSRTSRYAMLLALAFGAFMKVFFHPGMKTRVQGGLLGVLCAVIVLAGGYLLAGVITRGALAHYERLSGPESVQGTQAETPVAALSPEQGTAFIRELAERMVVSAGAESEMSGQSREAVDATFSDRTNIWRNLFDLWGSDLKKMLIGRGVGNTGSLIAHDTIHEQDGTAAVHNTYLQFIADFGLIGFILQVAFLLCILPNLFRGVCYGAGHGESGLLSMGMLVVAVLLIGLMESAPLGQMTPTNLVLYPALAFLSAKGEALVKQG
ncbi:MAG: O-antigen ligase family protein [Clostridia bacterium]|nr:O-antigen ligase family protein [Clostridia bacterium]